MMDTTTSRAEFEKWLEEVHGLYDEDIDWEPERNCYRIFGIHLAWCARRKEERKQKAINELYDAFNLGELTESDTLKAVTKNGLTIMMFRK